MEYKIHIANTEFSIPSNYSVKEWMKIQSYDLQQEMFWPHIISQATGMTLEHAKEIPTETQQVAVGIIAVCLVPKGPVSQFVGTNNLIDLDKMTFGQFIDLEIYLGRGLNQNLENVCNILYSCQDSRHMMVREVWPAVDLWMQWRNDIYRKYKLLFDIESAEDLDEASDAEGAEHAWYSLIMILADGQFLQTDQVVDKPLISALNFLAYKKDEAIKAQRKLQESKKTRVI